jgi:hypothetical protein
MNAIDVLDETVLREVQAINLRGLRLLLSPAGALVPGAGGAGAEAAPAGPLREVVRVLSGNPGGLPRLADQPFLLFDIGLDDPLRWHAARTPAVGDDPTPAGGLGSSRESALFAGTMFHYAWYLARTAPLTAAVVAGMVPATAELLRSFNLQQIDELSQRSAHWLRLRWEECPALWNALLGIAGSPPAEPQLRAARLQALLRLAGAALARRPAAAPFNSQPRGSL